MTKRHTTILLLHAASTLFMTGLIWFVQVVHYPLFAAVGPEEFAGYASAHSVRTAWVVVPVMLLEMGTAIWLVAAPPPGVRRSRAIAGLLLLTLIWFSTAFLQVPRHERLGGVGFDSETVTTLVATNWVRTGGWTLRSMLVLLLLSAVIARSTRRESS
ncbi:MAG: hypothetical protein WC538_07185 [Thermoanaerobaculia bacterium]|jgi:hypothetical protein